MSDDQSKDYFEINTKLYEDLIPYKDYFAEAIRIYFKHAVGKLSCDYIGKEPKKTVRLKIIYKPEWHKEIFELIEKEELKIQNQKEGGNKEKLNRTVLINNIMSTLLGIEQYN